MAPFVRPHQTRASDLRPKWHVIDADGKTLGRLGTEIATLLQGKHNPMYVPNLNTGDFVVVVNAEKVRVTGNKLEKKMYYRHSGYHGGLKEQTLADVLKRTPIRVLRQAVKGMLPKNSLGRQMLSRLKLYAGNEHPHAAQVNAGSRIESAPVESESEATAVAEASPAEAATTATEDTKPKKRSRRPKGASDAEDPAAVSDTEKKPKAKSRRPKATATDAPEEGAAEVEAKATEDPQPAKPKARRRKAVKAETSEASPSEESTEEKTPDGEEA